MQIKTSTAYTHPAYTSGIRINPTGIACCIGTGRDISMSFIPHAFVDTRQITQILPWNRRAWVTHKSMDGTCIFIYAKKKGKLLTELVDYLKRQYCIEGDPIFLEGF